MSYLYRPCSQPGVRVSGEEAGELQRWVAQRSSEQGGDGVTQHLAQQSAAQMPGVARPHPLDVVALNQLTEGGLDSIANPARYNGPSCTSLFPPLHDAQGMCQLVTTCGVVITSDTTISCVTIVIGVRTSRSGVTDVKSPAA